MSVDSQDQQPLNEPRTNAQAEGDDGMVIPGSAPPLSPGRTDVNPDDQAGVDELPGNELETPRDGSDVPIERETPDIDVDNAEMDDAPDPR
ncbi:MULTISPECIES: hypothetical protein [Pseudomonadaceae]|uniref:hypothetical protein n=1 Tax=Pseudomonadaceae TaxID=135621 RepID=UPI0015E41D74|nr:MULTISPECIES: hypothetical protein [Pseudomonadaceae]MBA1279193.1 hypothetical protein [Stutzerimonas stutzeri]MBC8649381.1 hypothetical protein [Pseudomonas sp. MT4]QXY90721.1 hypothetical protein GYM54_03505 [Pseudomonas sp. MTM4]